MKAICIALLFFYLGSRLGRYGLRLIRVRAGAGALAALYETGTGMWLLSLWIFALGAAQLYRGPALWGSLIAASAAAAAADLFLFFSRRKNTGGTALPAAGIPDFNAEVLCSAGVPPAEAPCTEDASHAEQKMQAGRLRYKKHPDRFEKPALTRGMSDSRPRWAPLAWAALSAAVIVNILRCLPPPTSFDVLSYHLAVPKIFLASGGLVYIPTILYSNFPLTAEMLYLPAQDAGSPAAAALIHAGFGMMLAALIYLWMKPRFGQAAALIGTSVFYLTPLVGMESPLAMVDLLAAFYSAAAALALFGGIGAGHGHPNETNSNTRQTAGRGHPPAPDGGPDGVALAALFAGVALSVKWSCAPTFALLALCWFWGRISAEKEHSGRFTGLAGIAALCALAAIPVAPYLLKNYILTGNPVWPNIAILFGGRDIDISSASRIIHSIQEHAGKGRSLMSFVRLPWDITMHEWDFAGAISPVYLCFVPLYALVKKNRCAGRLLLFALLYVPLWFVMLNLSLRFLMPMLPLFAIVIGYTLAAIPAKALRIFCALLLALHLGYAFSASVFGDAGLKNALPVVTGKITPEQYLYRSLPEYEMVRWVNRNTGPNDKALLAEIMLKGYYLDVPYMWGHPIYSARFQYERMLDGDDMYRTFRANGITLLLFRTDAKSVYSRDIILFYLSPRARRIWLDFIARHTVLAHEGPGGVVLRIK